MTRPCSIPPRATEAWAGKGSRFVSTSMRTETGVISMIQGRVLGGTSAVNGLATLRGQPADYNAWADAGLEGWGWEDVKGTFIFDERDADFGDSLIHGSAGPLPVRRWRREEMSRSQAAFYDGMVGLFPRGAVLQRFSLENSHFLA